MPDPLLRRRALLVSAIIALVAAVVAVGQLGRLHPDEVFQFLEPANSKAFGFGVLAWEWQVGLRNWAVPGLLALLLRFAAALGIDDPLARRAWLEVPQAALHFAMLLAVWRLTARRVPGPLSLAAPVLVGLYPPVIHFAGRTMGESISTALMVIALERLDVAKTAKWQAPALAGLLLGAAVIVRYGSAVVVIAALLWLIAQRAWKPLLHTVLGGLVALVALGALDWATWGAPFHSFRKYLEFNVVSGQAAAQFGAAEWWFFLPVLGWVVLWAWPGLVLGLIRRAEGVSLFAVGGLAYLLAISTAAHKEARFLYPTMVLWLIAALPPWLALLSRLARPKLRYAALAVSLLAGLVLFEAERIPVLGRESPFAPERGAQFRLVVKAGREATGLVLVNEGVWGSPGFFYLGKNIPWFPCDWAEDGFFQQAMVSPVYNRAVTWDSRAMDALEAAGFKRIETQGRATLLGR